MSRAPLAPPLSLPFGPDVCVMVWLSERAAQAELRKDNNSIACDMEENPDRSFASVWTGQSVWYGCAQLPDPVRGSKE